MGLITIYQFNTHLPDQETNSSPPNLVACINHKYDAPLSSAVKEFRLQTKQYSIQVRFLNRFGQEVPEGFRVRTDLNLYIRESARATPSVE